MGKGRSRSRAISVAVFFDDGRGRQQSVAQGLVRGLAPTTTKLSVKSGVDILVLLHLRELVQRRRRRR